jgi:L-threonylcarbamoyladenylate synthase
LIVEPTAEQLDRAARALRLGQLVAFPTETVYGLGADARNPHAVARIFAAKGRPTDHPVIVHLAETGALFRWAGTVPADAMRLARAFWPGPLTLILPRAPGVPDAVTGGQDNVGLRVPSHPIARDLLARFAALGGDGVAAPSANRFGRISATTAAHVADEFGSLLELIVDGGASDHGIESTIVSFAGDVGMLLRPGAVTADQLATILGYLPAKAAADAPRASGTLALHYAPQTQSRMLTRTELLAALDAEPSHASGIAVLAHTVSRSPSFQGTWRQAPPQSKAYAHDLYANLRILDACGAKQIWIEAPPDAPEWSAVRDRLQRATYAGD